MPASENDIEQPAKKLWLETNPPADVSWDAVARKRVPGRTTIAGIGEGERNNFRDKAMKLLGEDDA